MGATSKENQATVYGSRAFHRTSQEYHAGGCWFLCNVRNTLISITVQPPCCGKDLTICSKEAFGMQLRRWDFKKNCKSGELMIMKSRYASVIQRQVKFDLCFEGRRLDLRQKKSLDRCLVPVYKQYECRCILVSNFMSLDWPCIPVQTSNLPDKWAIVPRVSDLYLSSVNTTLLPHQFFDIQFDMFGT